MSIRQSYLHLKLVVSLCSTIVAASVTDDLMQNSSVTNHWKICLR